MDLSSLSKLIKPINTDTKGEDLLLIFNNNPNIRAIPIGNENGEILGIIERATFLGAIATGFGREIFCRRTIESFIKQNFAIIELQDTIAEAVFKITEIACHEDIPCAIVFDKGAYFGLIEIAQIYRQMAKETHKRAKALEIANENANAALEAKSRFLATVSHEIRTPLNGVLGMAKALSNRCPEDLVPFASTILNSGEILLRVVNDLLDMSKIENGKLEISKSVVCLKNIIQHAYDLNKTNAKSKNLKFTIENNLEDNLQIKTDGTRLSQVLINILSNAIKFTTNGEVSLKAYLKNNNHNKVLEIIISDTGIGMSKEFQSKLFQSFQQEDNSNSRGFGGTGLGLAISKSIIESLDGNIEVWSQIDAGSCFTIQMPIEIIEDIAPNTQINEDSNSLNENEAVNILAAEDNPTNQLVLKTLLQDFPVEITFANNGQEAVEIFENKKFDLIFMDLQMPILDGIDATIAIREIENSRQILPTPIFALSANATQSHKEATQRAGFDGHLTKPIVVEHLLAAIEHALTIEDEQNENLSACA
jgi:two-component system, sensor histidine kinase